MAERSSQGVRSGRGWSWRFLSYALSGAAVAAMCASTGCESGDDSTPSPSAAPAPAISALDLLQQGKIALSAHGNNIQSVTVSLTKLVGEDFRASIPLGCLFVSRNKLRQDMVVRQEATVSWNGTNQTLSASVSTACANRSRSVPRAQDEFDLVAGPAQAELPAVLAVLRSANATYDVEQAAVWIVTDNANYDDLGILVGNFGFGSRTINQTDAAWAMRYCDEAGVDIKKKRIWADRQTILDGLTEPGIRTWLMSRM